MLGSRQNPIQCVGDACAQKMDRATKMLKASKQGVKQELEKLQQVLTGKVPTISTERRTINGQTDFWLKDKS